MSQAERSGGSGGRGRKRSSSHTRQVRRLPRSAVLQRWLRNVSRNDIPIFMTTARGGGGGDGGSEQPGHTRVRHFAQCLFMARFSCGVSITASHEFVHLTHTRVHTHTWSRRGERQLAGSSRARKTFNALDPVTVERKVELCPVVCWTSLSWSLTGW